MHPINRPVNPSIAMNVRLLTPVMGHAAGTYEVHSITDGTYTLKDTRGALFEVPASSVETDTPEPEAPSDRFPGFEPHEQRVLAEYEELSDRIGKLHDFLMDNGKLAALDEGAIHDLSIQHRAMLGYQDALFARIEKFGGSDRVVAPAPRPEPEEPPATLVVDDYTEEVARAMYDDYCAAVGGVAFNGDALPPASEFFEDARKTKQANAWRATAGLAIERIAAATLKNVEEATGQNLTEMVRIDPETGMPVQASEAQQLSEQTGLPVREADGTLTPPSSEGSSSEP